MRATGIQKQRSSSAQYAAIPSTSSDRYTRFTKPVALLRVE
jgi:hypothetical protein